MVQLDSTRPARYEIERLDRSVPVAELIQRWWSRIAVIVVLAIGWLLANMMPAVDLAGGETLSLAEISDRLAILGEGWIFSLTWFAGVMTVVAALVFPSSERFARMIAISAGAIVTMVCPYYVATRLEKIDENATSLGTGLIVAWVACGVAAALPWVALIWRDRSQPVFARDWAKWLFIFPAILWILLMTVFPLIFAVTTSRYAFRSGKINREVGWDNFRRLFIEGSIVGPLARAVLYAVVAGVVVMAVGIALAWLSNRVIREEDVRRVASFLPITMGPVALIYLCNKILRDPLNEQMMITFFFVAMAVVAELVLGFLLALFLNREIRARSALRTVITLPIFATPIAMGYLARAIFYETGGPVNSVLENFGTAPPWLSNPTWARIATVIVDVWQWTPFVFIIALAGLQSLPQDTIEAAQVDGAGGWSVFRYITLPLMAPILWLIILLRTIDAFKVFDIPQGLTLGGPGRATEYFSLFNYRTARKFFNYGEASAQAFLLLFVVMVLVTLLWGRVRHIYDEEASRA